MRTHESTQSLPRRADAFSLVEVVLAVGIVAFGLVAIFALLPTGMVAVQEAKSQDEATDILAVAASELKAAHARQSVSPILRISFPVATGGETVLLDRFGALVPTGSTSAFYKLTIEPLPSDTFPGPAFHLLVTWPESAQKPQGQVESLIALPKQTPGNQS